MPRLMTDVHTGAREFYVTVQTLADDLAESNFPIEEVTSSIRVWASKEYVSLDETVKADQLSAAAVVRWTVPYMAALDPDVINAAKTKQLLYKGRTYDIQSAMLSPRDLGKTIVLDTLAKVG